MASERARARTEGLIPSRAARVKALLSPPSYSRSRPLPSNAIASRDFALFIELAGVCTGSQNIAANISGPFVIRRRVERACKFLLTT